MSVADQLGYTFAQPALLTEALTHRSWAHENGGPDYERLEWLGDAVLQLCCTRLLSARFPDAREGELSQMRARLVSTEALAELSGRLGIGTALRLGIGEEQTGGRARPRNLAGATEAVLGALFTDGGLDPVDALLARLFTPAIEDMEPGAEGAHRHPVSLLQERAQREHRCTPNYVEVECDGAAHERWFVMEVRVGDVVLARGRGRSKDAAKRDAAETALGEAVG